MGYTTTFQGKFSLNKELDDVTFNFLKKLNNTRRMARKVDAKYGVEGEFYVDGTDGSGSFNDANIIDHNKEPKTQPGLWCQWIPTEDRMHIEWDGGEKFYSYIEWIKYIISKVLAPRGYIVNGNVKWRGEDFDDNGVLEVNDNVVMGDRLIVDYSINKLLGQVGAATAGRRNNSPSVSGSKRKAGVRPDGTKTKHQIYKEKQEAAKKLLEDQIASLEAELKNKDAELQKKKEREEKARREEAEKAKKKISVNEMMLGKIKNQAGFSGSLDDFKVLLHNLLEE